MAEVDEGSSSRGGNPSTEVGVEGSGEMRCSGGGGRREGTREKKLDRGGGITDMLSPPIQM